MSTPQEYRRVADELAALRTAIERLAGEWDLEGKEAEAYIARAHHSEIQEVMTEARFFPRVATEIRALLDAR